MKSIIDDLKERKKALEEQLKSLTKPQDEEERIWEAEVSAKLEIVGDILGEIAK